MEKFRMPNAGECLVSMQELNDVINEEVEDENND